MMKRTRTHQEMQKIKARLANRPPSSCFKNCAKVSPLPARILFQSYTALHAIRKNAPSNSDLPPDHAKLASTKPSDSNRRGLRETGAQAFHPKTCLALSV